MALSFIFLSYNKMVLYDSLLWWGMYYFTLPKFILEFLFADSMIWPLNDVISCIYVTGVNDKEGSLNVIYNPEWVEVPRFLKTMGYFLIFLLGQTFIVRYIFFFKYYSNIQHLLPSQIIGFMVVDINFLVIL